MNWCDCPTEAGVYLVANPLITPLKPYRALVVEADGRNLGGLDAGLWAVRGEQGNLQRVETIPVIWFGPIPVDIATNSECSMCRSVIYLNERRVLSGGQWVHETCAAETAGVEVRYGR